MKEPAAEIDQLASIHRAQVISYLKSTGIPLGLLININVTRLKDGIRCIVLILMIYIFSWRSWRFKINSMMGLVWM